MEYVHPLLQQHGFTFKAPPLKEFVDTFSRLVTNGELSMVCYGEPRAGKTTSRRFLRDRFTSSKKMLVASCSIVADRKERESRAYLWRQLLRSKDQHASLSSAEPYITLLNLLCVEADMLKTRKVLVILDEAQNLNLDQLSQLKALVDDLIEAKLSPFVLLIAQPTILARPARLKALNMEDLVDRFFTNLYRFRGVKMGEIAGVLKCFDTEIEPADTGAPYTAYFLPDAWQNGWRLEGQSALFESEFAALHKRLNTGSDEVGMKYLVSAVRVLFNDLGGVVPTNTVLTERVSRAVADCGLAQSYRIVGNTESAAISHAASAKGRRKSEREL